MKRTTKFTTEAQIAYHYRRVANVNGLSVFEILPVLYLSQPSSNSPIFRACVYARVCSFHLVRSQTKNLNYNFFPTVISISILFHRDPIYAKKEYANRRAESNNGATRAERSAFPWVAQSFTPKGKCPDRRSDNERISLESSAQAERQERFCEFCRLFCPTLGRRLGRGGSGRATLYRREKKEREETAKLLFSPRRRIRTVNLVTSPVGGERARSPVRSRI